MHRLLLFLIPILLFTSLFIVGSQAIGRTLPDVVDHFGFGWCNGTPCLQRRVTISLLHDAPLLPSVGDFVRMFGTPCGLRLVRATCIVDHRTLQRMCRPRQVAVLYSTLMITARELMTNYGAEFTAEQETESVALTDLAHNYCQSLTINDVTWRGFSSLDHYWP